MIFKFTDKIKKIIESTDIKSYSFYIKPHYDEKFGKNQLINTSNAVYLDKNYDLLNASRNFYKNLQMFDIVASLYNEVDNSYFDFVMGHITGYVINFESMVADIIDDNQLGFEIFDNDSNMFGQLWLAFYESIHNKQEDVLKAACINYDTRSRNSFSKESNLYFATNIEIADELYDIRLKEIALSQLIPDFFIKNTNIKLTGIIVNNDNEKEPNRQELEKKLSNNHYLRLCSEGVNFYFRNL